MAGMRLATLVFAAAIGGCAYNDYPAPASYGDYAYEGRTYAGSFGGEGAGLLDPWLADTEEGRKIVRLGFQDASGGRIDEATADRANIWFRRYADTDRDLCLTDEEIRVALIQASLDREDTY